VSFSGLSVLGSTSAGNVLVLGTVTGTGVTSTNSTGIWVDSGGVLSLLARNGDPAPGDTSRTFTLPTASASIMHMDAQGDVAFASSVTGGTTRSGIWAGKPGNLKKIIEDSDAVPGVPAGITWVPGAFRVVSSSLSLMGFAGDGRGTFLAKVQGTGITGANNIGIWSFDPDHGVRLIARSGDTLHVGPGDNRVIANLYTVNSVNNSGMLSFSALFTDGSSGIFLARQQSQDFVANSSFTSQDLSGWAVTGDGSAQAMETTPGSGQFAAQLTTGSPVDLSQSVDVPYSGSLGFNYQFQTTTGTLSVYLNNELLDSIPAPAILPSSFSHDTIALPADVRGLNDALLDFHFDGPSGSQVLVTNVTVPEPGAVGLALTAIANAVALNRRRRRK
jgi:hypothetical protein